MPIVQSGSINTTALVVPDLYVQIVPPSSINLNGVPTNVLGVVGTAQWGPVNQSVLVSSMATYFAAFGSVMARKYDMGTQVATATQQGASNFRCVRVTDGTDAAASVTVLTNCITFTGLYTGSLGNSLTVTIGTGSKVGTFSATVALPGVQPEVYGNIAGTGNAFWVALASAINVGNSVLRGKSNFISAVAGVGTTAPALATYTLTGGTDGVTTLTAATLVGVDAIPRTGMYALRGQGCSVGLLADTDDSTQWTTQGGFGLSEGIYMILTGAAGSAIQNGTTGTVDLKQAVGLDNYAAKLMHGDWLYWNDATNGIVRLVSPQGFAAGRLVNLSPEQSSLNKQLYSIIGSQKSGFPGTGIQQTYAAADLQLLFQNGIDVISNPQPGGFYWGVRCGHNSSSNPAVNGDNYTRMTDYIAATLSAGMGLYVGEVINGTLFQNIKSTLLSFLNGMLQQGLLGLQGTTIPFTVVCDLTNNPQSRTSLGYVQADVAIQYQGINEKFIVNVQGGETVVIATSASGGSSSLSGPLSGSSGGGGGTISVSGNAVAITSPPSTGTVGAALTVNGTVTPSVSVRVGLSTTNTTAPTAWAQATVTSGAWTIAITPTTAGTYYIWAEMTGEPSVQAISPVVTISAPITDGVPTALTVASETSSTLVMTWTAPTGTVPSSYTLQYAPHGTTSWTTESGITGTTYTITGLTASTEYDVEVCSVSSTNTPSAFTAVTSGTTSSGSGTTAMWQAYLTTLVHASTNNIFNLSITAGAEPATVTMGFSTSATVAPTSTMPASNFNTNYWGAYLTAPATAGTYYGWAFGYDSSSNLLFTIVGTAITVT